jgi:heat shock protein HtpX
LLQLGLSRSREYDADREGAWLSGDPEALASALQKIENYQGRVWESIFVPGRRLPVPSILRTHPSSEERIRRLRELGKPELPPLQTAKAPYLIPRVTPFGIRPRYRLSGLWY